MDEASNMAKRSAYEVAGPSGLQPQYEQPKATSFLDKRNYPVSPRSERAYEDVTNEFDRLFELCQQRKQQQGGAMQVRCSMLRVAPML